MMMKKTMIALAAFAAVAGAAHAQSSVTLYGVADVYVGRTQTKSTTTTFATGAITSNSGHTSGMASGGLSGSRWGVRGMEDLGGGLKATFQLEAGFSLDNGLTAETPLGTPPGFGAGFNRTSKVGLAGGFGSIDFGRQYTRVFNLIDGYDAQGTSSFSATNAYFGGLRDAVRWDNSIVYATPNLGGFDMSAQYAFGENATATASAGHALGLAAGYTGGPFSIQGAYQAVDGGGGAATQKSKAIGASYDFGVVKLLGQVIHQDAGTVGGADEKFHHVSVSVPVGSMSAFNIGYGKERRTSAVLNSEVENVGVEYRYSLSKRTTVYAAIDHTKAESASAIERISGSGNQYAVGMRHAF